MVTCGIELYNIGSLCKFAQDDLMEMAHMLTLITRSFIFLRFTGDHVFPKSVEFELAS